MTKHVYGWICVCSSTMYIHKDVSGFFTSKLIAVRVALKVCGGKKSHMSSKWHATLLRLKQKVVFLHYHNDIISGRTHGWSSHEHNFVLCHINFVTSFNWLHYNFSFQNELTYTCLMLRSTFGWNMKQPFSWNKHL